MVFFCRCLRCHLFFYRINNFDSRCWFKLNCSINCTVKWLNTIQLHRKTRFSSSIDCLCANWCNDANASILFFQQELFKTIDDRLAWNIASLQIFLFNCCLGLKFVFIIKMFEFGFRCCLWNFFLFEEAVECSCCYRQDHYNTCSNSDYSR